MSWPAEPCSALASMTAIARGRRMCSIERTAAVHSRSSTRSMYSGCAASSRVTWMTPESSRTCSPKPAERKTPIMRWLSGRTSATKRPIPRATAAEARCSSSTVPRPRPWWSSAYDESHLGLARSRLVSPAGGAGWQIAGRRRRGSVVTSNGNQLSVDYGYERQPFSIVDGYEMGDLLVADARVRGAKKRKYTVSLDSLCPNERSAGPSSGRIGRSRAVRPSEQENVTLELGGIGPLGDRPLTGTRPARSRGHLCGQHASRTGTFSRQLPPRWRWARRYSGRSGATPRPNH